MGVKLLGLNIDNYSFEEGIYCALDFIKQNKSAQIITINPEMFDCAEKDKNFAQIINEAEMVIPDGVGVKIALKLTGKNAERLPGIDFARRLLEESAKESLPVAIIGAKEEVLQKATENLTAEIPGLNIVYCHNGYFSNDNEIYEQLKEKAPKLVLVAMGSPRQEYFIYNAKNVIPPALMIGIGGSLDVWSGMVKRAPAIYQKLGLEWLYRTITQPERFKRIFPALPLFLLKVLRNRDKE